MARFSLTRPITKDGECADYWYFLLELQKGKIITRKEIDKKGKYMTYQALKERGLIKSIDRAGYKITDLGEDYISYYKNKEEGDLDFFKFMKLSEEHAKKAVKIESNKSSNVYPADNNKLYKLEVKSESIDDILTATKILKISEIEGEITIS